MDKTNENRVSSFVLRHSTLIGQMLNMWNDPHVQCYNDRYLPAESQLGIGSAFLAGPTSRNFIMDFNWRCVAVKYLREAGFKGWIYIPEPRGEEKQGDFTERGKIHHWESSRLLSATHIVFWIPRQGVELLGLNTNLELGIVTGMLLAGKKLSLFAGWPPEAERMGLPNHYVVELAKQKTHSSLEELCKAVAAA